MFCVSGNCNRAPRKSPLKKAIENLFFSSGSFFSLVFGKVPVLVAMDLFRIFHLSSMCVQDRRIWDLQGTLLLGRPPLGF